MHFHHYLYQIIQELKNLEPSFLHDLIIALVPTIPSLYISYWLFNKNNELQNRLHNINKQEAMRLEYLRFREQVGLTRWHIERMHSSLPYLATSGEISSVKTRLQQQIDTLMLSAERYSFIGNKPTVATKTREISLRIEGLLPCIDDFMDSDEAKSAQDPQTTVYDRQSLLEASIHLAVENSPISNLYLEIADVIGEFKKYEALDEIKPLE